MLFRALKAARGPAPLAILLLLAVCAVQLAGEKKDKEEDAGTRTLQGLVTDAQEQPLVGAVVQLKDMRTLQIRSYLTKEDGTYRFSGLKTDVDYQVKADFGGASSGSRTISVFDSRKVATINLKVEKK